MKRNSLILVIFILVAGMFLLPYCTKSDDGLGWIAIEGNSFVNESGETMVFHGVNLRDPHNLEVEGHWTKAHFQEAKAWGANVIRLPIHPPSWRTRSEEGYLILLDQAVNWARELGLYLILDWHSIGNLKMEMFQHEMYITSVEETSAFWSSEKRPGKINGKQTGAM